VLEEELEVIVADMNQRADLRFGALLQARGVKAAQVVVTWGSSRGEHAGELSKEDFRRAVIRLLKGLPPKLTRQELSGGAIAKGMEYGVQHGVQSAEEQMRAQASEAALELEIDGVFDMFDADRGGYLDAGEALTMIKTLQCTGDKAAKDRRFKEYEARAVRSKANRLGLLVREAVRSSNAEHHSTLAC
jgi:hypothetical protein